MFTLTWLSTAKLPFSALLLIPSAFGIERNLCRLSFLFLAEDMSSAICYYCVKVRVCNISESRNSGSRNCGSGTAASDKL